MGKNIDEKTFLNRINLLRGLFALDVVLSHIWFLNAQHITLLIPFNKIVTICVFAFFFLSGYGMCYSNRNSENYIKKIIFIKIPKLITISLASVLFGFVIECILSVFKTINIYTPLSLINILKNTNWYVYEQAAFYLLFALIVFFIKNEKTISFILSAISLVAFFVLINNGIVEATYNSIFGFSTGIFFYSVNARQKITNGIVPVLSCTIVALLSFLPILMFNSNVILCAACRNICGVCFMVILVYFVSNVDIQRMKLGRLASISTEIFFYHFPVVFLLNCFVYNEYLYLFLSLGITIIIAFIMHIFDEKVIGTLFRKVSNLISKQG